MKKFTISAKNFYDLQELLETISYLREKMPSYGTTILIAYLNDKTTDANENEIKSKLKIALLFESFFCEKLEPMHFGIDGFKIDELQSNLFECYSMTGDEIFQHAEQMGFEIDLEILVREGILVSSQLVALSDRDIQIALSALAYYKDNQVPESNYIKEINDVIKKING
jgi:hypothetical protein